MANSTALKKPLSSKEKSFKFTTTSIIILKGYIFENDIRVKENGHYRYLNNKEFIKYIADKDVNDLTKYYIKACKKLKNYDLRNVDQNLKSLKLI